MAKFSGNQSLRRANSLVGADTPTSTFEGGTGFAGDAKSELYRLATTALFKDKFYETEAGQRDRMVGLVREITKSDPEWVQAFVPFLRRKALIRSMSVAVAVEYAMAGGPNARQVIDAACARADEPAEVIGYAFAYHGRSLKSCVKRGVGDAARRLYTEYAALKYDGNSRDIRPGDVLNLCHVKPRDAAQGALFAHLLNERHGNKETSPAQLAMLPLISASMQLRTMPEEHRRQALSAASIKSAGWTWENVAGWVPGGMDAAAWEAVIPAMPYAATLRNLRNFTQAGVSDAVIDQVLADLADPERVAKSRQFPIAFWKAYQATDTEYQRPLGKALKASFANVPRLGGNTLIMIDTSGSMRGEPSEHAAVLAACFREACDRSSVFIYANHERDVTGEFKGINPLADVKRIRALNGVVGHGTETWPSTESAFRSGNYDRIVILTDMQDHPAYQMRFSWGGGSTARNQHTDFAGDTPIYVWDLGGYQSANVDTSAPGRFLFSGINDASLKIVSMYEQGRDADWMSLFNG